MKEKTKVKYKVMKNGAGFTVASLYILPNGNLHCDSWLCPEGWGSPAHNARMGR